MGIFTANLPSYQQLNSNSEPRTAETCTFADESAPPEESLSRFANEGGHVSRSPTRAPRLYVGNNVRLHHIGQVVELSPDQTRYLLSVMRLREGSVVRVFDGVNGEYSAVVCGFDESGKIRRGKPVGGSQQAHVRVNHLTRRQPMTCSADDQPEMRDIELIFAPIRKQRLKILVEKAVEVGASQLTPIITARTQANTIDQSVFGKLGLSTAVEAAEQCERMTVPPVGKTAVPLASLLKERQSLYRDAIRRIFPTAKGVIGDDLCSTDNRYEVDEQDEKEKAPCFIFVLKERDVDAPPLLDALEQYAQAIRYMKGRAPRASILVGPEGGFDQAEINLLATSPIVRFVSLGSNILRAETAAVYALSCWSAFWASRRALEADHYSTSNVPKENLDSTI